MARPVKTVVAAVVAAVCLLSFSCGRETPPPHENDAGIMLRRVQASDRLVLARMRVTKMATVDDVPLDSARGVRQVIAALADAAKIGSRKAAYSYDTYLSAYVDLSETGEEDITVDESGRRVRIRLPEPEVRMEGRDAVIREDHYRVTGLRTAIGPAERAALKEKMNTSLREEVDGNDEFSRILVENAKRRGETFFRELFADLGYETSVEWGGGGTDISGPAHGL